MIMKILNYLNVSNPNNLESDSGFIFQKLLMNSILEKKPNWEFYFLSPNKVPLQNSKIKIIEVPNFKNKYQVRFDFDWKLFENVLYEFIDDIDLFLVNQSEQTSNFYSLVHTISKKTKIPFITYFHYLPIHPPHVHFGYEEEASMKPFIAYIPSYPHMRVSFKKETKRTKFYEYDGTLNKGGLAEIILMRQAEAVKLSDYSVICSNFGKKLLENYIKKHFPKIKGNYSVIPPPVSATNKKNEKIVPDDKKIIVYNHRLYRSYGTKEFLDFMTHFYNNERKDFEIVFTDPTSGRSAERNGLDPDIEIFRKRISDLQFTKILHKKTQEEYFDLVNKCYMEMGPMKTHALWSMAVVDAMICGKPTLCPNYAAFPEITGGKGGLLYSSRSDLTKKLNHMFDDAEHYTVLSDYCEKRAKLFDASVTADKFIDIFENAVGGS